MRMTKCVTEKYEAAKSVLTEMLKEPTHIALSTDIWTNIATLHYSYCSFYFTRLGTEHIFASNYEFS